MTTVCHRTLNRVKTKLLSFTLERGDPQKQLYWKNLEYAYQVSGNYRLVSSNGYHGFTMASVPWPMGPSGNYDDKFLKYTNLLVPEVNSEWVKVIGSNIAVQAEHFTKSGFDVIYSQIGNGEAVKVLSPLVEKGKRALPPFSFSSLTKYTHGGQKRTLQTTVPPPTSSHSAAAGDHHHHRHSNTLTAAPSSSPSSSSPIASVTDSVKKTWASLRDNCLPQLQAKISNLMQKLQDSVKSKFEKKQK